MAELLYRLGRFCARRAWTVVITWIVVLGLSVTGYLAFGGALSSQVTIPGTATEEVTEKLAEKFPSASGGNGAIVFHTTDGSAFTAGQRTGIAELLKSTAELDGVDTTTDPFTTEQQIAQQSAQIAEGRTKLEAAREQLPPEQRDLAAAQF
jgi:putative drug exporter of the RND superfamily